MTQEKQEHTYQNRKYIDTPGLADIKAKMKAAEEIENALKSNGNYKIIFVITLDKGRLKPQDFATIDTVCNCIQIQFDYGLIYNHVTNAEMKEAQNFGGLEQHLKQYLETLKKKPSSTVALKKDLSMEDSGTGFFPESSENRKKLLDFISNLKANMIPKDRVTAVDVTDYEEKMKELTKKIEEQNKRIQELQRPNRYEGNWVKIGSEYLMMTVFPGHSVRCTEVGTGNIQNEHPNGFTTQLFRHQSKFVLSGPNLMIEDGRWSWRRC